MDVISKYHDFKIIHGDISIYIYIYIYIYIHIVCILTLKFNLFFCVRFQSIIKEAFVANAI